MTLDWLVALEYGFAALIFRALSDGHWSDWTDDVPSDFQFRIGCRIMSIVMMVCSGMLFVKMFAGPLWALVLVITVTIYWTIHSRSI